MGAESESLEDVEDDELSLPDPLLEDPVLLVLAGVSLRRLAGRLTFDTSDCLPFWPLTQTPDGHLTKFTVELAPQMTA